MKSILNEQLRAECLPSPNADWYPIQAFALTFDGYRHRGLFKKCAEIANCRRASSLTELRACLFFEQRRWRHFGDDPEGEDLAYMHGLVERIRSQLVESQAE